MLNTPDSISAARDYEAPPYNFDRFVDAMESEGAQMTEPDEPYAKFDFDKGNVVVSIEGKFDTDQELFMNTNKLFMQTPILGLDDEAAGDALARKLESTYHLYSAEYDPGEDRVFAIEEKYHNWRLDKFLLTEDYAGLAKTVTNQAVSDWESAMSFFKHYEDMLAGR